MTQTDKNFDKIREIEKLVANLARLSKGEKGTAASDGTNQKSMTRQVATMMAHAKVAPLLYIRGCTLNLSKRCGSGRPAQVRSDWPCINSIGMAGGIPTL